MNRINARIDLNRAFGIKVLLKLTAQTCKGLKISPDCNGFCSNVDIEELNDAVNKTIRRHNIALRSG